jgi:hypothetical protein
MNHTEINTSIDTSAETSNEQGYSKLAVVALAVGALAAVAAVAPRGHDSPEPLTKNLEEQVIDSAQIPYNPATDTLVVKNITLKPGKSDANTPSEAVLGNLDVKLYAVDNPDEAPLITTSAMSLPTASHYALVERDVNKDGDPDTIAVPVEK